MREGRRRPAPRRARGRRARGGQSKNETARACSACEPISTAARARGDKLGKGGGEGGRGTGVQYRYELVSADDNRRRSRSRSLRRERHGATETERSAFFVVVVATPAMKLPISLVASAFLVWTSHGAQKMSCEAGGTCTPDDQGSEDNCTDLHDLCPMWAKDGECILNPRYMVQACRESCILCVNVKSSRERGESDEDIRRKELYLTYEGRTGPRQRIVGTPEEQNKIKSLLKHMDRYAKVNLTEVGVSDDMRKLCRNEFDECASWAVQGKCRDDSVYMLNNCPLACHMCDKAEEFQRCAGKSDPRKEAVFQVAGDVDKFFREGKESGKWDEYGPEYISEPKTSGSKKNDDEDSPADPWIVRFDKFLSDDESQRIIEVGNEIGWHQSVLEERELASGNPNKVPPRRTSKSAICKVGADCDTHSIYSAVLDRVATITGIPRRHIEHVELVKYDKAESFGVHHDYRVHDNWKPGE